MKKCFLKVKIEYLSIDISKAGLKTLNLRSVEERRLEKMQNTFQYATTTLKN